ncbi:MAG: DUF512 domain-containing protein [Dehalococcoidia bacterium]
MGSRTRVVAVRNRRFGALHQRLRPLNAADIVATLREEPALGDLVLPRTALDYFGRKFLDDATPNDVAAALSRPVRFASTLSEALAQVEDGTAASTPADAGRACASNGRFWA